jgi:sugar phosphate isomerase/epimerase
MKFAICNETFQDWPLERGFAFAAECGYQGVEIAPFTIAPSAFEISSARRSEIRRQAESAGLEVVGLHWLLAKTQGLHLTSPDAGVRRKTAEYLAELARLCADLGGRVLVFGSPQQRSLPPGVTPRQGAEFAAEVIAAVLPELQRNAVLLALEPLTPEETNFLLTAAETVELIERIGAPQVRLHLDCKAMSSEAEPMPRLIVRNARYLVHFHANDPNRQGPGFGALNFLPIFRALQVVGYAGWMSVEVFDYTPGVERLARDSFRYLERCRRGGREGG